VIDIIIFHPVHYIICYMLLYILLYYFFWPLDEPIQKKYSASYKCKSHVILDILLVTLQKQKITLIFTLTRHTYPKCNIYFYLQTLSFQHEIIIKLFMWYFIFYFGVKFLNPRCLSHV
jgi:hypothetical protein